MSPYPSTSRGDYVSQAIASSAFLSNVLPARQYGPGRKTLKRPKPSRSDNPAYRKVTIIKSKRKGRG